MTTKIKTPGITDANVTTDKLNLISTSSVPGATIKGTAGQSDGYIQLNCEQNTHGIKLKSPPHSSAQNYTLTFPQSITNGYFLKTDGSGNLSFAEVNVDDTAWQSSIVTAATLNAVVGYGYWINTTSNACTITLPGSANVGDQIIFVDYARTWATNAVTINPNSLNFQGNTSPNPVYNTAGQTVNIVYSGATQGWIPVSDDDVTLETPQSYSIDYLVVAGGAGGGGCDHGGGGGAGGLRTSTQSGYTAGSNTVTVTVGGPGAGGTGSTPSRGVNGSDSSISGTGITTITSTGGGGGGGNLSSSEINGSDGGSGGGGAGISGTGNGAGGSGNTPSTSPSQGNNGGNGNYTAGSPNYPTGGGGGAGAVGGAAVGSAAGNGGNGTASSITGSSVTYAGGGGGSIYVSGTQGTGGTGGGGAGQYNATGTAGTANTGGGGGGSSGVGGSNSVGGAGGSGVVILSMPDASYSGTTSGSPTVATGVSGKTILTFTGSGSYTT